MKLPKEALRAIKLLDTVALLEGVAERGLNRGEVGTVSEAPQARAALQELLAFPDDLPDLATKRPPGGNARPGGIAESCFERRRRGELPEVY
jgi:hypothetical protein